MLRKTWRKIPLLARGLAFCSAKHGGKSLCSPEGSHFAPQNMEENPSARQRARILLRKTWRKIPLLARGLAFCSAKQGGIDKWN
ncbi:hypothetical protein DXC51_00750 [Eisenbergiella massiliensis]|uniref:Uncharacterized protein n=1 Tax=Eisenbergiella massiliensis TaxID=1720294 RepID=A0A3E3ICX8_9FIRM|nr:hypothetical protein DXC51_00750 [Eisenbergiella massiliensis]